MESTNETDKIYTPEELEKLAEEYRGYPNKKGRPPKAIAKQIAAINKQKTVVKVKEKDGKKSYSVAKPDKLEAFIEEFIKNGGNATQAALVVTGATTTSSASVIGSRYLKEAKMLGRIMLEKRGFHYGKMIDVATEKMMTSKTPEWWDRLMKIADYDNPIAEKKATPPVVNIVGTMRNDAQNFGFEEADVVEDAEEV